MINLLQFCTITKLISNNLCGMKYKYNLLLLMFFAYISQLASSQTRIACIGNSVTYGKGIVNREKNSYPAQLQSMLGVDFEVRNFGTDTLALITKGKFQYSKSSQYKAALAFEPNIVFVMLGADESRRMYRNSLGDFEKNFSDLIASFKKLESVNRIVLLTPIASFNADTSQINAHFVQNQIIPRIEHRAVSSHCEFINLYNITTDIQRFITDGVHPTAHGATVLATRLYEAVVQPNQLPTPHWKGKNTYLNAYRTLLSEHNKLMFKLVQPMATNAAKTWVLKQGEHNALNELDLALLERGYYILMVENLLENQEDELKNYLINNGLLDKYVKENVENNSIEIITQSGQKLELKLSDNKLYPTNPTWLVNEILRDANQKINFAIVPCASGEYRSSVGWYPNNDWWSNVAEIEALCEANNEVDILFVGNSITQGWGGNRTSVSHKPGKAAADSIFAPYTYISAGIASDRTQHILWRMLHSNYEKTNAKIVVLMLGINNFSTDSPEEIVAGIEAVVGATAKKMPQSHLLLLGALSGGIEPEHFLRKKHTEVHNLLKMKQFAAKVKYVNISDSFILSNGKLNTAFYSSDGVHLSAEGYFNWAKQLKPIFDEWLK